MLQATIRGIWETLHGLFSKESTVATSLLLVGVSAWAFYFYQRLKWRKKQLPFSGIPYANPKPHWFFGHLKQMAQPDVVEGLRRLVVDHAGSDECVSTFWFLNMPVFSALDAKLVNRILKFSSYRQNNKLTRKHFRKLFGEHSIIMLNGKEWKANREIYRRAFSHTSLPDLQRDIWKASLRVEQSLLTAVNSSGGQWQGDLVDLCRMAALDVFGICGFAHDFGCTRNNTLSQSNVFQQINFMQTELTRRCFQNRMSIPAQFYWFPTATNRRLARENRRLRETLRGVIQKRRRELDEKSVPEKKDLLSSLLRGSRGFSDLNDDVLADWLITAVFGGYDTTSLTLAYTLYALAKHPSYQQECANEIASLSCAPETFLSAENLPFLFACYREALRYYPPTATTARSLEKALEIQVDGKYVVLPAGARCVFSLYWIHHSGNCARRFKMSNVLYLQIVFDTRPTNSYRSTIFCSETEINFPRPDEFLPERWVQRASNGTWQRRTTENDLGGPVPVGDPAAIVAFSSGARNCVGQPLGEQMVVTLSAVLLRRFHFEPEMDSYEIQLERCGASQVPSGGIPVRIRSSESSGSSLAS